MKKILVLLASVILFANVGHSQTGLSVVIFSALHTGTPEAGNSTSGDMLFTNSAAPFVGGGVAYGYPLVGMSGSNLTYVIYAEPEVSVSADRSGTTFKPEGAFSLGIQAASSDNVGPYFSVGIRAIRDQKDPLSVDQLEVIGSNFPPKASNYEYFQITFGVDFRYVSPELSLLLPLNARQDYSYQDVNYGIINPTVVRLGLRF